MERIDTMSCPRCDRELQVIDITEPDRRAVGLVYLTARCACRVRMDAAGVGLADALVDLGRVRQRRLIDPDARIVPAVKGSRYRKPLRH